MCNISENSNEEGYRDYLVPGLSAKTSYHMRARSRNKAGLSDASNIIILTTKVVSAAALNDTSSDSRTRSSGLVVTLLLAREVTRWL